jgi:hypothetical protein
VTRSLAVYLGGIVLGTLAGGMTLTLVLMFLSGRGSLLTFLSATWRVTFFISSYFALPWLIVRLSMSAFKRWRGLIDRLNLTALLLLGAGSGLVMALALHVAIAFGDPKARPEFWFSLLMCVPTAVAMAAGVWLGEWLLRERLQHELAPRAP